MKISRTASVIALLSACICPAFAQAVPEQPAYRSGADLIKADRAKDLTDKAAQPTARPWDRDRNGKRPWEVKLEDTTKCQRDCGE